MKINELNDAWIESGQKVSDLNDRMNVALNDDNMDMDDYKALKAQRDTEKERRDALKDQLEEARAMEVRNMKESDKKPLTPKEENMKDKFVSDFKALVRGQYNAVTSITTDASGNAGLTIPQDIQTAIHTLVRQYATLQNLVNVEGVGTSTGSRVYEKWVDITPLADLEDETAAIGNNDDPQLTVIKYTIHRYAGITTVTNTLLKDTAENILGWLSTWISHKVAVTRNQKILTALNTATKKPTLAKFDDIKDMTLTGLDPAILATSSFVTNQSGFAVLAKVKNAMGNYLIQRDVTQPEQYLIEGKPVAVVADRWLPDVSGSHPLYFGDFKQAVTLFDRENMSLLSTNIGGGGFETDTTKIRVIDRFDVETVDDGAYMVGSFTKIADQPANFAASAPSAG
ncbi:phage major capsid protein [Limosilactobacillus fermentum]|uniref:phage major capsid protein n=1 Tax=Limosilactobacillus fermentum TaxID=1613 RepID=UPI002F266CB2